MSHHISGEFTVEDVAKPGEVGKMKVHDILHVGKGCTLKWGSPTGGKGVSHLTASNSSNSSLLCVGQLST
jgi:hypothetical protein